MLLLLPVLLQDNDAASVPAPSPYFLFLSSFGCCSKSSSGPPPPHLLLASSSPPPLLPRQTGELGPKVLTIGGKADRRARQLGDARVLWVLKTPDNTRLGARRPLSFTATHSHSGTVFRVGPSCRAASSARRLPPGVSASRCVYLLLQWLQLANRWPHFVADRCSASDDERILR